MTHKAFEVIGKKVLIEKILMEEELNFISEKLKSGDLERSYAIKMLETGIENIGGIFLKSDHVRTTIGGGKGYLDLIQPIYTDIPEVMDIVENHLTGEVYPRINPNNPVLDIWFGVDSSKLDYLGLKEGSYVFRGNLFFNHEDRLFVNDGNYEIYDKYKEPLRKAGFKIE